VSQASEIRIVAPPGVFRPRSDTWMLADIIGEEVLPESSVLDLCTGSGAVAIAAARGGAAQVTAIDVSRRSAIAVRANALLNRVSVRPLRGDLFGPVAGERFDFITSNPPYLPSDDDALPDSGPSRAWEGGADGRRFIDRIIDAAPDHLRPCGSLLMVHSSVCGVDETLEAIGAAGLRPSIVHRHRGPVGPLLRERAPGLREEELLVFRGDKPPA
jgi:release factor glutamine methyltransferase